MRRPALTNWDQALIAIWALIAVPIVVSGWLHGALLPRMWSGSPLLIQQIYDAAIGLLVYGLPVVIVVRIAVRALH